MPIFRCLMRGENFPGAVLNKSGLIGFYATRYVEADSAQAAELAALELLKGDPALDAPPSARTKDAQVFFEAIEEAPCDHEQAPNAGFSFFVMGT